MSSKSYDYCVDYVILGGGSAGCVMANLLSADKEHSVLLLDVGPNVSHDPILNNLANRNAISSTLFTKYFWQGVTLEDPSADDQTFDWMAGRVLGGSSSINDVLYMRGSPNNYDQNWVPLAGPEWSGEKVYAALIEMENYHGPDPDPENHGHNGLMYVRTGVPDSSATPQFMSAFTSAHPEVPVIQDYNNPKTQIGVFTNWTYFEFPDSTRASSLRTYLNKNVIDEAGNGKHGRKLKVLTKTFVSKLMWDSKGKKVKGAYAIHEGKPISVRARKEVIVSMGMNSPQFLQVNGIGPKAVLEAANVPVKVDNPWVGNNLVCYPYTFITLLPPAGTTNNTDPGTLNVAGALLANPLAGSDPNFLQFKFEPQFIQEDGLLILLITMETPLLPKSRGSIQIYNGDPTKIPAVQLGLLTDPENYDLNTQIACYQYVVPVLQNLINQGYILLAPTIATIQDTAALTAYIQSTVGNTAHYQASNRMSLDPAQGVVNPWGHVHGVKGLMVADNSIAADGTNGNPNSTAEMIGYRIAKRLIEENEDSSC